MWRKRLPKQKVGAPITAQTLREIAEAAEWSCGIDVEPPLEIVNTGAGPLIRLAGWFFSAYVGTVATGGISARVSATPGSGNVNIGTWNGSTLGSLGVTVPVLSISSTTGGVPEGTYCIVLRIWGAYWLITVDCGN